MLLTMRVGGLLCLASVLSFARTWSGALVDSKCYASEERNVNPTDTMTAVDRDGGREIRYCSPSPKTKSFALVSFDGQSFPLDAAGNAKAAALVHKTGKTHLFDVAVTGQLMGNAIQVDSITPPAGR